VTATAAQRPHESRAITYAWAVLCAITIGSWWLSPGHTTHTASPSVAITTAVVLLGFIKGRLVIRYFMAVNTAPRWLKLSTDAWLFALWAAVLAIYVH
jgi:apolipoprotein N-acyltransferase